MTDATLVWQNCLEYWNVQGYHSVIEKAKEIRDIFKTEWIDNVVKPLKCQYEIELSAMKTSTSLILENKQTKISIQILMFFYGCTRLSLFIFI